MGHQIPTANQARMIRAWMYLPILLVTICLVLKRLFDERPIGAPDLFVPLLVIITFWGVARKIETSLAMSLPSKAKIAFAIYFGVMLNGVSVASKLIRHQSDWHWDLVWGVTSFLIPIPFFLYFRRAKPDI